MAASRSPERQGRPRPFDGSAAIVNTSEHRYNRMRERGKGWVFRLSAWQHARLPPSAPRLYNEQVREAPMTSSSRLVVAISHQMGSGGGAVGLALARTLGIRYADREILEQAARLLGKDDRELEGLEERVASLWGRVASILALGAPEAPYVIPAVLPLEEEDLFLVESRIIREIASREDAVIVGRGAAVLLRDHPGLVTALLHAPEDWRVEQVMRRRGVADRAQARELVRQSDQQRRRFVESLRGGSWLDPSCYHLCIDTAAVGQDAAVELLARLARRREPHGPEDETAGPQFAS
ncbi:MAG: cytidylate kinase-like family protein [Acidobacteria bacterium]|nr:MAG: cytidylate kinase-like family protein [Acidobacteriota bacterium]